MAASVTVLLVALALSLLWAIRNCASRKFQAAVGNRTDRLRYTTLSCGDGCPRLAACFEKGKPNEEGMKATPNSFLEERRPDCPDCEMRMIAKKPHANVFECLRCGHSGKIDRVPEIKQAAE
jgi:hypothetical protein